jgi:WD repeat and SOF domain-containing protein 1
LTASSRGRSRTTSTTFGASAITHPLTRAVFLLTRPLRRRWIPFDQSRNFPDLGPRFQAGERVARGRLLAAKLAASPAADAGAQTETEASGPSPTKPGVTRAKPAPTPTLLHGSSNARGYKWGDDERDFADLDWSDESVEDDERDLPWSAVLKRTFEAYLRGERPNMYGEYINWSSDDREY